MEYSEHERIKLKLEQDFPFNNIQIYPIENCQDKAIFFNGQFTGFTYSVGDTLFLDQLHQKEYAEIVFYESLRKNIVHYLVTNIV